MRDVYRAVGIVEGAATIGADRLPADLLSTCYDDMRRIARRLLAQDAIAAVLQPTDLVNEAAIRLLRAELSKVSDGGHLLAIATRTMRQVLIDEARKRMAGKRKLLTHWPEIGIAAPVDFEALHEAMASLHQYSPDHAEIVELRYMLGLTLAETVAATGLSQRTVTRRWQAARLWLLDWLGDDDGD